MTTPADPIRQALVAVINPKDHSSWDEAWKQSITPWDAGHAQPGLVSCIESGAVPLKGRALVPGCGAGYDPIYLASVGFDVVGLDVSETALAKARVSTPTSLKGSVTFKYGNFFELTPANDDEKFDLIYDYTFFVAIPPSLRSQWGTQMRALLKPGGYLITLVYPIAPYTETGPPYYVRPEHYVEVMGVENGGWEKVVDKESEAVEERGYKGDERLIVWKRV
ncbi:methyl chloride transferase [Moniliophthora roreri MCA 2997]|uniref:Methyl chloride transferase n=2 Tax=Moniliophthora roreri TaxID=221103 RepID=V2Y8U6_MONRO|nr:methyl chloride transferase [Moniliophthora roreri MCA 2997]KAI3614118.1 methyl chloride transferase [Moniliophthora roreri]